MKCAATLLLGWLCMAASASAQVGPTPPRLPMNVAPRYAAPSDSSIRSVDPSINYGNLYMYGQTTRGTAFRGNIPYAAPNALRLTLPSERLDNWRRDSFGIENYQAGPSYYAPRPYFSPSGTTYSSADALAGRLRAQTGVLTPAPGQDYAELSPYQTIQQPKLTVPPGPYDPLNIVPMQQMEPLPAMPPGLGEPAAGALDLADEQETRPQISVLFGLRGLEDERSQAVESADRYGAVEGEGEGLEEPAEPGRAPLDLSPSEEAATLEEDDAEDRPSRLMPPPGPSERPEQVEKDVFAGVLQQLSRRRDLRYRTTDPRLTPARPQSVLPSPSEDADMEGLEVEPAHRRAEDRPQPHLSDLTGRHIMLDHLAGREDDSFNRQMRLGDRKLRAAQFYQAATHYESAQLLQRNNPLAPAGAALAYLGAGESYRAGLLLRRAMRVFPAMVRVRLDVDQLLGAAIVDQRLEEMTARLQDEPLEQYVPLVFLTTFLYAGRSDEAHAAQWARKLASVAGEDRVLMAYVRQLLPDEDFSQPASAPAAPPDAAD